MKRSIFLDFLKGIAIIAVIFYHSGCLSWGYLGVEVFFVISGYLTTKGILHSLRNGSFSYRSFIMNRLARLWPLALIITVFAFVCGYFFMLPMNFKNLCETVFGTSWFGNNFVQYVVSSNYWDQSNDFKPLMHTWYLGVIFQFYLFYPLIFILANRCDSKKIENLSKMFLTIISVLSLAIYLTPSISAPFKFYFLPARLFEFCMGGLVAIRSKGNPFLRKTNCIILVVILIVLMAFNQDVESSQMRFLMTVAFTAFILTQFVDISIDNRFFYYPIKWIALCGISSYSLYLWHQVFLAYTRYAFAELSTTTIYLLVLLICFIVGFFSYFFIEKPISSFVSNKLNKTRLRLVTCLCFIFALILSSAALYFYKQHGLVRDVPELALYKGMYSSDNDPEHYNESAKKYDVDFSKNGKINVLVIGDSFGRDWVNVLLQSNCDSLSNISYHTDLDDVLYKRFIDADIIFFASNCLVLDKYDELFPKLGSKKYWRVGHKNFGSSVGLVYNNNRYKANYFQQKVRVSDKCNQICKKEKELFDDKYIDVMGALGFSQGKVPIFTPDNMLISHDGLHLTKAGASYLAERLDISSYLK